MTTTSSRTYSDRETAIENAKPYSNHVKQDVYVYMTTFGNDQEQFTLRIRSEIMSPDSPNVIHHHRYIKEL